jgi:hypothetical protein
MVYYFGETLPYHQALALEKADWLRRIRANLAENKEREKQAQEAQAKYQEQQRIFRERAAQGILPEGAQGRVGQASRNL